MYKKNILPNGLRIITVPMLKTNTATVLVLVATGSKYETKKINGISHFLEHMTFKGTKKRPTSLAIAEPLDRIGSQFNAFTGHEYTGYFAKADSKHLDMILDIVSDITLNPIFNQEEINKERGVIIEEINMYEDSPIRKIDDIWTDLLYGDQPAGWDTAGKKEIIAKLQRNDFIKYHNDHYVAPRTILVVAGKINSENILKKANSLFRTISGASGKDKLPTKESQNKPRVKTFYKKTDQTHIALGVRAYNIFDERRFALEVIATILGGGMSSRLFDLLRNKMGAAYYVKTAHDGATDTGDLATWAGIDNRRIETIVRAILGEYKKIKQNKVTKSELDKAKERIEGSLILSIETSDELASFYGFQEILKNEILEPYDIIKKIRQVTVSDVYDVANDIFRSGKINLAMIGPSRDGKKLESLLKL